MIQYNSDLVCPWDEIEANGQNCAKIFNTMIKNSKISQLNLVRLNFLKFVLLAPIEGKFYGFGPLSVDSTMFTQIFSIQMQFIFVPSSLLRSLRIALN